MEFLLVENKCKFIRKIVMILVPRADILPK